MTTSLLHIGSRSSQFKSTKLFAVQGTPYVVYYNKQNPDDRAKITTGVVLNGRISENRRTLIRLPSNRQYTFIINLFHDGGVLCKCVETKLQLIARGVAQEGTKRIIDFYSNGTITCISERVEIHEQQPQMSMEEWVQLQERSNVPEVAEFRGRPDVLETVHDLFDNSDIVTTPTAYGEDIRFLPRQLPSTALMSRDVGPS